MPAKQDQSTMKHFILFLSLFTLNAELSAQEAYLLSPDRVFDGIEMLEGSSVLVIGQKIVAVGQNLDLPNNVTVQKIDLSGMTLLPGLIEGHGHLFLYPYDEANWNDQVLKEDLSYRSARAVVHAEKTLMAGFTTLRDLGTEGAGYADRGIKRAIDDGVILGPRLIIASKAIVATGSYGPTGFSSEFRSPLGAEAADGPDLARVVRDQIGHGADIIKVYADYRWGPNGEAMPSFSLDELSLIVETAKSSGRPTVAHAATEEGIRRAILAGVETIEHGDGATQEIFQMMKEKGVALCPTLGAVEAISGYRGWNGKAPYPKRLELKRQQMNDALSAGINICAGSDVGVFDHGDNAWELELMRDYGMEAIEVLKSATSGNAKTFHLENLGLIKRDFLADLIAVVGNPLDDLSILRSPKLIMKDGTLVKKPL